MNRPLTIVTYHYVRDSGDTEFPKWPALSLERFRGQLDYLAKHFTPVSPEQLIAALMGAADALPPNGVLLTFDDGYRDHFDNVLPLLLKRGLKAAFFPAAKPVAEQCLLKEHKVHFVLATVPDSAALTERVFVLLDEYRSRFELDENAVYYDRWAKPGRWDPPEVMFVKRLLQRGLPSLAAAEIADRLFRHFVTRDEADLAEQVYMSMDQLRDLGAAGMYIGNHGYAHEWLDRLSRAEQEKDIDRALDFLAELDLQTETWIMCYPHGSHDDKLRRLLRKKGCVAGLTDKPGTALVGTDDPLTLKRIDTNFLPHSGDAKANDWTQRINAESDF